MAMTNLGSLPYSFAIVGVQKAATSTLSEALALHPHIAHAPRKELQFFNREDYDWSAPDYDRDYRAPRRSESEVIVGDATPAYLWWPGALARMQAYDDRLRLIAVFRDPIERLFSHWSMIRGKNPRWLDWPEFITNQRPSSLPLTIPTELSADRFKHHSGVARGYYSGQLEIGLSLFSRSQWLLMEFSAMLADFPAALDSCTSHLGVPPFASYPPAKRRLASPPSITGTAPTTSDIAALAALYADDLQRFEPLSGLAISHWPTVRINAGTLDPADLAAKFAAKVVPV